MTDREVFIFEYVSGGGFNNVRIPSSLLCEGYGMLRSLINDFITYDFKVRTLLDERIDFLAPYLTTDEILLIKSTDSFIKKYKEMISKSKYCFIIAPEFSNILLNLTKLVLKEDNNLLSQAPQFIKKGTSKLKNYYYFKNKGLPTPNTYKITLERGYTFIQKLYKKKQIHFPLILKPEDGAGAEDVHLIKSPNTISPIINKIKQKENQSKFIIQDFIDGINLSASVLGVKDFNKGKYLCKLLSINFQDITLNNDSVSSEYLGGYTPFYLKNKFNEKSLQKHLNNLKTPDFSGYFGIDFIYKNSKIFFIEINPRLTTSYLGLRNVLNINPAKLIFMAKNNQENIPKINTQGNSIFKRFDLNYNGEMNKKIQKDTLIPQLTKKIPELITAPFSVDMDKQKFYSCLIATKEKSLENSERRIDEILSLLEIYGFSKIEQL